MKKVVLVTGASRGIGAATAKHLSEAGYTVIINYRHNADKAQELAKQLSQNGATAIAIQADVSQENEVVQLFEQIDKIGPITALVNNVGILQQQMPLVQMSAQRFNHVLTTNVTSCFLCCREAVRRMSTDSGGKGGAIVNVSSVASRIGGPGEYIDYAASKGAMDTLTTGLSVEVAAQGIRVNSVRPGFIYTDMHADGGEPNRVDRLTPLIPMKRGGTPHEVATAIAWLLSDEASYVTGSFIDLAGGK